MATNKQILEAYHNAADLKKRQQELQRAIKAAQKELDKVEHGLELARQVSHIVEGIPVTQFSSTKTSFDMRTFSNYPNRSVHAYKHVNEKFWLVRVNVQDIKGHRYHGGQVIGFGAGWTRAEAVEISNRWITGDETVLKL